MTILDRFNNWAQKQKQHSDPKSYCNKCGHYHYSVLKKTCMKIGCNCKIKLDMNKK